MLEEKLGPSVTKRLDNMQWHFTKLKNTEKSINFLDKFDEIVGRLPDENKFLRSENQCLKGEVHRTTNLMEQLNDNFSELQQYSRRDYLELRGLLVCEREDTN